MCNLPWKIKLMIVQISIELISIIQNLPSIKNITVNKRFFISVHERTFHGNQTETRRMLEFIFYMDSKPPFTQIL